MRTPLEISPALAEELQQLRRRVDELERERNEPTSGIIAPTHLSADYYKLLYEDTPSMSFALSPDGTILSVNRYGADHLGYSTETLVGQSVLTVFDPIDHHAVREQLSTCACHPYKILQWVIQKVCRDGTRLWVRETARAVRDVNGALIILVICEDITATKSTEEEARSLTTRLEALIRTSPLAIMALDNRGETVTIWNHAAEQMFGWSEREVLGKPAPFLPPDCRHESDRLWNELLEHGQLRAAELRRVRKDGTPIDLSLWATVLRDQQGNIVSTFGLLADITEQKRIDAAIRLNEQAIRGLCEIVSEKDIAFDQQIRAMLDLGRRRFQLPIAAFTTVKGQEIELTVLRSDSPIPTESTLVPLCQTLCSQTLDVDHPLAFGHIGSSNWKDLPAYAQLGFEAYLGIRVTVHGIAIGTICFLSYDPVATGFSEADLDFLRLMARWVSGELERQQAEANVRHSEERFRLMFENAPVGMCILNQDKTLRKINPAFQQLVGYSEEEILDRTYALYTHPDDLPGNLPLTDQLLRGDISGYSLEKRYIRKSGECIWVNVTTSSLQLPGEADRLLLAIVEDITSRKNAESALRFTQFSVDHAGDLLFVIDEQAHILTVNEAAAQRLGYSQGELSHMTVADIDPNYQPDVWPQHWEELRKKKKLRFESSHRTKEGQRYPAEIVANHVEFEGREYNFAFTRDISERKAAEEALRRSEQEVRQAFDERERLSQDLHDNLLQSLYAVGMGLEVAKKRVKRNSPANAKRIEDSVAQLNAVIREVRSFIPRIYAPALKTKNVADALRSLVGSFVATGAGDIALTIDPAAAKQLSPEQSPHILAIAKEALSNSVRHAKADNRSIALTLYRGQVQIEVADDGRGFQLRERRKLGMGIRNMRSRATKLNARFSILTSPGKGTLLTLILPPHSSPTTPRHSRLTRRGINTAS